MEVVEDRGKMYSKIEASLWKCFDPNVKNALSVLSNQNC